MRLDVKGKFSAVAKEESISGVHSIKNLSSKRLPLMGRLVHGSGPSSFKAFQATMRILSVHEEDFLVGIPLLKNSDCLVELPLSSCMRLVPPKNTSFLETLSQYTCLIEKASHAIPVERQIEVIGSPTTSTSSHFPCHTSLEESFRPSVVQSFTHYDHKKRFASNSILVRKCIPSKDDVMATPSSSHPDTKLSSSPVKSENSQDSCCFSDDSGSSGSSSDSAYEEIDQIYDYIRGFAPLPETVKRELEKTNVPSPSVAANSNHHHHHNDNYSRHHNPFLKNNSNFQDSHHHHNSIPDSRRLSYPTAVPSHHTMNPLNTPVASSPDKPVASRESNHSPPHTYPPQHHNHRQNLNPCLHQEKRPLRSNSVGRIFSSGDDRVMRKFPSHYYRHPSHHHLRDDHPLQPQASPLPSSSHRSPVSSSPHHLHHQSSHGQQTPSSLAHPTLPSSSPSKTKLFVKRSSTAGLKSSSRGYHMLRYSSSARHIPLLAGGFTQRLEEEEQESSSGSRNNILAEQQEHPVSSTPHVSAGERKSPTGNQNISNNDTKGHLHVAGNNNNNNNFNCHINNNNNNYSISSGRSLVTSPIFNIRYKSLTNINFVPPVALVSPSIPINTCLVSGGNEKTATLDSNNSSSGKKTNCSSSNTSKGSPIYESICKKNNKKKLSKPKSLNNIFRELASAFSSLDDKKSDNCSSSSCDRNDSSTGSLSNNRPFAIFLDRLPDKKNNNLMMNISEKSPKMQSKTKAIYM